MVATRQRQLYDQGAQTKQTQEFMTVGSVVDTNDPQQMGRIRAVCPQWGDTWGSNVEDLPWCLYVAPFGGQTQVGTRGPGVQETQGGVSYGMWAIPKVGAQVLVMCVDGNPMTRVYMGCLYDQFTPHTMPHGRYMYDDHPELEKAGDDAAPYGPYSSSETFIQPLAANLKQMFGSKAEKNYEYRSRGADYSVSHVGVDVLGQTYSKVQDDTDIVHDDWTSTQGYQVSRQDPFAPSSYAAKNYDSMTYSITTPGFHAFSMDDRQENCRVRIRTTSGHQIILDDTNERIYIATAQGNNWVELDQAGNIDVYSASRVTIRSAKEINMTSDETIRMYAKKGIHMHSDDEVRIDAAKDIHVKSAAAIRSHSTASTYVQSDADVHVKAATSVYTSAATDVNVKAGSGVKIQAGSSVDINSGSNLNLQASANLNALAGATLNNTAGAVLNLLGSAIVGTGATVDFNGPGADSAGPAASATDAQAAAEQKAFFASRVPDHEPWARTMTKDDTTLDPEFTYDDKKVGRFERGMEIVRGMFWRR